MTQPYTSADFDNDWAKERQFIELKTEERFGYRPARPRYFSEETKEDFLSGIVAENVRASNDRINYHE